MKKVIALAIGLALSMASCTSAGTTSQDEVSTIVAATLNASTPTQQAPTSPTPQGIPISFQNVSLIIPEGLGLGANSAVTDDIEYPPCANPSCVDPATAMPQHIVITIAGYPLEREARIAIFNAAEFAGIGDYFQAKVSNLQALDDQSGIPQNDLLPFVAAPKTVSFAGVYGFRYLTQMNDGIGPIDNSGLFYYFQGLTQDGAYFVQAVLPVSAPFLATDGNPETQLPADGVPFPTQGGDLSAYFDSVAQHINLTTVDAFTPSLAELDAMIESLKITP